MAGLRTFLIAGALFALIFTNASYAQTISIVQGNGQLVCDGCASGAWAFLDDLVVLVSDANGNPVSNATVTWSVTAIDQIRPPFGTLASVSTVTGTSTTAGVSLCPPTPGSPNQIGVSCNRYSGNDTAGRSMRVIGVTASLSNGKSVTFTLTEVPNASPSGSTEDNAKPPEVDLPVNSQPFSGTANSTFGAPITVILNTAAGAPIPNVSVRLIPDPGNPAGPSATCLTQPGADPGSVLTNSSGTATCNIVFGPGPSPGQPPRVAYFYVLVGGVVNPQFVSNIQSAGVFGFGGPNGFAVPLASRFSIVVTPATPNAVQIISGNNQSTNHGSQYAAPLVVKVVDASSPPNPLPSSLVTWSVSPAGYATVIPASTNTDSTGQASTTVTLTSIAAGPIQVTATTSNGKSVTFNLSINVQLTGLTIVSSTNNQSVSVGQLFQPIAVQTVVSAGQSPAGIPVQFTVTSGPAILTQSTAISNASGQATVGLQAGNTPGPVTIQASSGAASVTFNLTVLPPGLNLTSANFLNGAGFFPTGDKNTGALSPCSIGTVVVGTPLTAATLPTVPNLFGIATQQPTGATVTFNSESAPILGAFGNAAQTLITFQVPCDVTPGTVPVSVTLNNATTIQPVQLAIHSASPGIFELPMSDGVRRAVAVKPDGTFVSLANPARRGEIIRIYVTGIGPTSPALATNALPTPGVDSLSTAAFLAVQVGTEGVPVLSSSRASPSLLGVFELDIAIPPDAPQGNNTFLEVAVLVNNPGDYQFANPGIGSKIPIQ